ncbi:uncharacterized protein BDZ99DRAFT_314292 [Mytilinidion resinicola]|uniref:F-box domain-containing protein n=1 Tax=Mytilinidion resinicola TaxID=574789 RepID=A0A6A6YRL1_9PEZI|nr:uncharacterized protein BDZ99DRAFT_314292 [Mytilinidion resinicola]KAF2810537.1 hypothetical protein BDZ99DRAFT_314292 [Mytilinidion resinicola]
MECRLTKLPTELQLLIIEKLQEPGEDSRQLVINLSNTCSSFRSLLAPKLFHSITLHNTEGSAALALAAANNHIAQHVKRLDFKATLFGTRISPYSYFATRVLIPKAVRSILGNLNLFPKLDTLSIQFDAQSFPGILWDILGDEEPIEDALKLEKEQPWRRLMAETYKLLCGNKSHSIKTLLLQDLIPLGVSTFTNSDFHKFLSTLEHFRITLLGGMAGHDGNFSSIHNSGYKSFVSRLPVFFLDHLDSVKTLSIAGTRNGMLGLNPSTCSAELPLANLRIPNLESFSLEWTFIYDELIQFLTAHAKTLKLISLHNCYGHSQDSIRCVRWHEVFDKLADVGPISLKRVDITIPTAKQIVYYSQSYEAKIQEVQQLQQKEPERLIFAYGFLSYGILVDATSDNTEAFINGDDEKAYARLAAIVKANRISSPTSKKRI